MKVEKRLVFTLRERKMLNRLVIVTYISSSSSSLQIFEIRFCSYQPR